MKKKLYVDTGHKDNNDQKILAFKNCNYCGGRGFTGKDIVHNMLMPCKCIKTINLPVLWVVL